MKQAAQRTTVKVRQRLGAVLLAGVIITVMAVEILSNSPKPNPVPSNSLTVVNGYGGGLKVELMGDPDVQTILAEQYGLRVEIKAVGSNELACDTTLKPDDDFVWLGDSVVLDRYRSCGGTMLRDESVFYSPLVLYTWVPIADELVSAGIARHEADDTLSVDLPRLIGLIEQGRTWADLNLPQLHGAVSIQTSDPQRSNSGFLFTGLLANTLAGGGAATMAGVDPLLPRISLLIQRSGYMPGRSSDLWNQYLATGMGAKPIVALYESQIIEHTAANPQQLDQINSQVQILYPQPTVWATHPYVARTAEGEQLLRALKDPEIQRLAAERHGHRPSVGSVPFAPSVTGVRRDINSVVGMPAPSVMEDP